MGIKVEFTWSDLHEIWMMAYRRGYESGYMDKANNHDYYSGTFAQPPEVLRKIFESSEKE